MIYYVPRIVLSNHDEAYLKYIQAFLVKEGYVVIMTTTNLEAYTRARDKRADIVILDVPMVGSDTALSTLNLLRLDPQTRHIPVLICSMNPALIAHNQAYFLSRNCAILLKPFHLTDLLQKIREMLAHP